MSILGDAAIAHFGEAEDALDHSNCMFNLAAHARLDLVLTPLHFVDYTSLPIAAIDAVLRARCVSSNHLALAAISLVAPHACLSPVQQHRQQRTIGDIRRGGRRRVNELGLAVDANTRRPPRTPFL